MDVIANIFYITALTFFSVGVITNLKYLCMLPFAIPKAARWPALIWLVMLAGLGQWVGRSSSVVAVTSVDSSATIQIASILIAGMIMLVVASKSLELNNFKFPFLMLFLFALIGLLTAPVSDVPALSVFKASSVIVAVLLAVMAIKPLSSEKVPGVLFDTVFIYFTVISFLAVFAGLFFPELTHRPNKGVFSYMLEGWPHLNSNSLSYVAAVVFIVGLRRIYLKQSINRRLLYIGVCSVGLVTLIMAQGRTSLISSAIAILFMSYFIKDMRSLRYIVLLGFILMILVFMLTGSVGDWVISLQEYMQRGVTDEQISTMSGRTGAWSHSWGLFLDSPIIGYGFYAAGKTVIAPHNAYFTVLLNVGLLGFIPWFFAVNIGMWMIFCRIYVRSWRVHSSENSYYFELAAVMIIQFFRTITGQDLTVHSYSMLIFLAVLVYMVSRSNGMVPRDKLENDIKQVEIVPDVKENKYKYESVSLRK